MSRREVRLGGVEVRTTEMLAVAWYRASSWRMACASHCGDGEDVCDEGCCHALEEGLSYGECCNGKMTFRKVSRRSRSMLVNLCDDIGTTCDGIRCDD